MITHLFVGGAGQIVRREERSRQEVGQERRTGTSDMLGGDRKIDGYTDNYIHKCSG